MHRIYHRASRPCAPQQQGGDQYRPGQAEGRAYITCIPRPQKSQFATLQTDSFGMHTPPLAPLLPINRPDDDYLTLYILWLRMVPVHEYLKTLLLRKMIKFRCKKKVRREKHGRGPSYTHREKKRKPSVNVYVELKGETYTV